MQDRSEIALAVVAGLFVFFFGGPALQWRKDTRILDEIRFEFPSGRFTFYKAVKAAYHVRASRDDVLATLTRACTTGEIEAEPLAVEDIVPDGPWSECTPKQIYSAIKTYGLQKGLARYHLFWFKKRQHRPF